LCAEHEAIVEQLLQLGAEVDPVDDKGWTPLHTACAKEYGCGSRSVELLLNADADMELYTDTVHHSSSSASTSDALEHLQGGWQPLHFDALNHTNYDGDHMLGTLMSLQAQVDIDVLTLNGCTGLWLMVRCHEEQDRYSRERLVALLDEQYASLYVRTSNGWGLLHAAAAAGGTTMLQLWAHTQGCYSAALCCKGWTYSNG
jgi:Ankyrin repeat